MHNLLYVFIVIEAISFTSVAVKSSVSVNSNPLAGLNLGKMFVVD